MKKKDLIRVFAPGGLLSPEDLRKIVKTARYFGNEAICFGSRQDILFSAGARAAPEIEEAFAAIQTPYDWEKKPFQNIVTSTVATNLLPATPWVLAGTYFYALDQFNYRPSLKINITDPAQGLVPLFSGHLNFIASPHPDYWFLYLKLPGYGGRLRVWPVLIYTLDIARTAQAIEEVSRLEGSLEITELFTQVNARTQTNNRNIDTSLELGNSAFPDYEGFNKMNNGQYWLGLYWRNNRYPLRFLEALCGLCAHTGTGQIAVTPWKSFIVKDIAQDDLLLWERLLGKYGINARHSSLELNWHLPVLDGEALQLKRYLVKAFDRVDVSTSGLSFSVNTCPEEVFTSVSIEKKSFFSLLGRYDFLATYSIRYRPGFNPNEDRLFPFQENLSRKELKAALINLTQLYYRQLNHFAAEEYPPAATQEKESRAVHQCRQCLTVYDEQYEGAAGVVVGILFQELPDSWCCPLCDSPKTDFRPVEAEKVYAFG